LSKATQLAVVAGSGESHGKQIEERLEIGKSRSYSFIQHIFVRLLSHEKGI
jgi:hypothetical protein